METILSISSALSFEEIVNMLLDSNDVSPAASKATDGGSGVDIHEVRKQRQDEDEMSLWRVKAEAYEALYRSYASSLDPWPASASAFHCLCEDGAAKLSSLLTTLIQDLYVHLHLNHASSNMRTAALELMIWKCLYWLLSATWLSPKQLSSFVVLGDGNRCVESNCLRALLLDRGQRLCSRYDHHSIKILDVMVSIISIPANAIIKTSLLCDDAILELVSSAITASINYQLHQRGQLQADEQDICRLDRCFDLLEAGHRNAAASTLKPPTAESTTALIIYMLILLQEDMTVNKAAASIIIRAIDLQSIVIKYQGSRGDLSIVTILRPSLANILKLLAEIAQAYIQQHMQVYPLDSPISISLGSNNYPQSSSHHLVLGDASAAVGSENHLLLAIGKTWRWLLSIAFGLISDEAKSTAASLSSASVSTIRSLCAFIESQRQSPSTAADRTSPTAAAASTPVKDARSSAMREFLTLLLITPNHPLTGLFSTILQILSNAQLAMDIHINIELGRCYHHLALLFVSYKVRLHY
jgi:hypothetical protein